MARIEETVEIKRPLDKVFTYMTDARVGTTFEGISRMMGLSMKWTAKTSEYELNRKWSKNITCGGMTIEEHVTYDPIEGYIKVTIVYDIKVGGFLKLFSPMVVSSTRKETKKSLSNLKSILEAQT
ncbi:MAG TPA: hypothetical protein VEF33_11835 [Syntrophales bacterium]|nr:hypothetical protein [Syntrophales bacterium]